MYLINFIKYLHLYMFIISTTLMFIAFFALEPAFASGRQFVPLMNGGPPKGGLESLNDDFTVGDNFSSSLPVIIIDSEDNLTAENVNIPGKMFKLRIIDGGEVNRLDDLGDHYDIFMERIDPDRLAGGKGRYKIRLLADAGASFFRMPAGDTWMLQGDLADKAMIRNALAYTLATDIIPMGVPQFRYVEVLLKKGESYHYQGLYLFTEDPERILRENNNKNEYILKYPAAGADLSKLNVIKYSDMNFELITPIDDDVISAALKDIEKIEAVLNAKDASTFYTYSKMINQDSFASTYIINEYMLNFRDGQIPVYLVKAADGKIYMSPVWEFEHSIDNALIPVDAENAQAYNTIWLDRLVISVEFLRLLEKRYYKLGRGVLEYKNVNNKVVGLHRQLGDALWRDWHRWKYEYTEDDRYTLYYRYSQKDKVLLSRQTDSPEQELIKIKHNLRSHGQNTKIKLKELHYRDGVQARVVHVRFDTTMALFYSIIFFISVVYSRKKIRES